MMYAKRYTLVLLCLHAFFSAGHVAAQENWNVTMVGSLYDFWEYANDVAVSGDYAYVAAAQSGLQVVDVSGPTSPVTVGHMDVLDAYRVSVSGDYAYVVDIHDSEGFVVADVSDPRNPILTGYHGTLGPAYGVAVSGDYVYVAGWYHFAVFDCSAAPVFDQHIAHLPTSFALIPTVAEPVQYHDVHRIRLAPSIGC